MIDRRAVLLALLATPLVAACRLDEPAAAGRVATGKVASTVARVPGDPSALPAAVRSMWTLGNGLWARVSGDPGNLALSPYSIATALALTVNGAAGQTRAEMLSVLEAASVDELNHGVNALTREIEGLAGRKVALDAANQLFGQRGVAWEQDFLDVLAREYGAGLRTVDFATEGARDAVNAWTAERTHDRIPEILPPGSVGELTRLVLVNALYFKAPWAEPFEEPLTRPADFHLTDGGTIQVPTMRATLSQAATAVGDGWQAVQLPYAGGRLAMTVVLPDAGAEVAASALPAIIADVRPAGVELALPRWTFRTEVALREELVELGMPTAFAQAGADFTPMTEDDEHLLIDDVYHQVFVAVDEHGTEAAAATAVVVRATSAVLAQQRIAVDRPFLFVIHDREHGTPLFVGRVDDPR
ncbi:serpin family protein [Nocardioides sp. SR21]|uniref:serpin family protein n=1 Tax=Nocardioides sp. SR21 TaxID=2919501 RepID=UPI001FAAD82B|nr:serpin family protein [Nocardioides sp. SR21]